MIQLTRRERRLGISVAAALAVWGIYALAIGPMRDRIQLLSRVLPEKQEELRELRTRSNEYLALHRAFADEQEQVRQQDPDFQLLPFLESLAKQHQLNTYLVTMEQQEAPGSQLGHSKTLVEIGLKGIPLRHLIGFLRAIEDSSIAAQVASLHVRKQTENHLQLDATLQIYSPKAQDDTGAADLTL